MKKRIAILFSGNIYNVRGEFTAIHNRIKELNKDDNLIVDAYVFGEYFDKYTVFLRKQKQIDMKSVFELEGITYNCLWYQRSHLDNITHKIFKHRTNVEINNVLSNAELFKNYDLIYANSLFTAYIGLKLKCNYGIPFICMWHGSSIHTLPFKDKNVLKRTKVILTNANMNLFVSDELLGIAKKITNNFKGIVSYNGIDTTKFHKYTTEEKQTIKKILGISKECKCVAFVGNCIPIKNVQYLPILFTNISNNIPNVKFFIIGSGAFTDLFAKCNLDITYTNNIDNTDMPRWYGAMDLIVMPSINEGLPMTCLEATACGTPFVGSRVGAIADVVGFENTVEHDCGFNKKFIELCIDRLNTKSIVELPEKFILHSIIKKEKEIIETIINRNKYEK